MGQTGLGSARLPMLPCLVRALQPCASFHGLGRGGTEKGSDLTGITQPSNSFLFQLLFSQHRP